MIIQNASREEDQVLELRMVVAGLNSNGEPDLYFCKVRCDRAYYRDGGHYFTATQMARHEGYNGPLVAADEHDPMGRNLLDKFVWESATIMTVE